MVLVPAEHSADAIACIDGNPERHARQFFRRRQIQLGRSCRESRAADERRRADIIDIGGESTRPGAGVYRRKKNFAARSL